MTDQEILNCNIIEVLGLEVLDDKQKMDLINQMTELIEKKVMVRVGEALNEDDKKSLNQLVTEKGPDAQAVADFLRAHVPEMDNIFKEEIIAVKRSMIEQGQEKKEE